jgi:hypothetical protein
MFRIVVWLFFLLAYSQAGMCGASSSPPRSLTTLLSPAAARALAGQAAVRRMGDRVVRHGTGVPV